MSKEETPCYRGVPAERRQLCPLLSLPHGSRREFRPVWHWALLHVFASFTSSVHMHALPRSLAPPPCSPPACIVACGRRARTGPLRVWARRRRGRRRHHPEACNRCQARRCRGFLQGRLLVLTPALAFPTSSPAPMLSGGAWPLQSLTVGVATRVARLSLIQRPRNVVPRSLLLALSPSQRYSSLNIWHFSLALFGKGSHEKHIAVTRTNATHSGSRSLAPSPSPLSAAPQGVGQGLIGAVVRPISGTLDLATKTLEGRPSPPMRLLARMRFEWI